MTAANSAIAFQNPELLRAIADPALTFDGPKALADHLGRDKSNTLRTLKALRADGVIDGFTLTALGRRVLDGLAVAEGRVTTFLDNGDIAPRPERSAPLHTWPIDRFRANPANRKVWDEDVAGMADSIAAQGILQPLTASPPDADGVRTIWIGHRRWMGAAMARDQGRLHPSLSPDSGGALPFVEREATPAEALAMTLIENTERQDIPPLEEAFMLRDLADALDMTALALAEWLGRKPRDVQDKIRIARNASPEALAAYAGDGSWDRLRDSIPTTRKPGAPAGEIEELAEAERDAGPPFRWTTHDVHKTPFADRDGAAEPMLTVWVMTDGGDRYTVDWIANVDAVRLKHTGGEILPNAALALGRAIANIRWAYTGRLTRPAVEWLDRLQGPFVVDGVDCFNASNAGERRRAIGWEPRLSNSGGGHAASGAADDDARLPFAGPDPAASGRDAGTADDRGQALSPRARLALVEIAHKTAEHPRPLSPTSGAEWTGDPVLDFAAFGAAAGKFWLDAAFTELRVARLARAAMRTDQPPIVALTPEGVAWFADHGVGLPVSETELATAQAGAGCLQAAGVWAGEWLRNEAAPAPDAINSHRDAEAAVTADLYDRTPEQIAGDVALLDRVRAFADQDQPTHDGADFRSLWTALGLQPEVLVTDSGFRQSVLARPSDGSRPFEILTAAASHALPDERAQAIAWLAAWAIEQALVASAGAA